MKRAAGCFAAVMLVFCCAPGPADAAPRATPGPSRSPEWWFDTWHIPNLWAAGARGQGVTIAEIDTGVNAQLPELQGRILPGTDLGQPGDGRIDRQVKAFGHGTAMASLMVARPGLLGITGMAPDAQILPIAVPLNGTTDSSEPDKLGDAIRYAADHGAKVISMSVGGKRSPKYDSQPCPPDEQEAVYHALAAGAVLLGAVGNTGPSRNTIEEPAVCLGVVSVGAVDITGRVASFSTRQPYLSMVAPGVNIPSLGRIAGDAYAGDGTSQATALASASVALLWSRYPQSSGRQIVTRVLATLDGRRTTPSSSYGYGMLDTYRAATSPVAAGASNPVYDAVTPFLRRESDLARATGLHPPKPATTRPAATGSFSVGSSATGLRQQTKLGLGAAVAGLVGLVALTLLALRRRRARAGFAAATWQPFGPDRPLPPPAAAPPDWPGRPPDWPARPPDWPARAGPPPGPRRPAPGPANPPPSWHDV